MNSKKYIVILQYNYIFILKYIYISQKRPKKRDFCKKIKVLANFFCIFLGSLREKQYLCTCKPEGINNPSFGIRLLSFAKMVLCFFEYSYFMAKQMEGVRIGTPYAFLRFYGFR